MEKLSNKQMEILRGLTKKSMRFETAKEYAEFVQSNPELNAALMELHEIKCVQFTITPNAGDNPYPVGNTIYQPGRYIFVILEKGRENLENGWKVTWGERLRFWIPIVISLGALLVAIFKK